MIDLINQSCLVWFWAHKSQLCLAFILHDFNYQRDHTCKKKLKKKLIIWTLKKKLLQKIHAVLINNISYLLKLLKWWRFFSLSEQLQCKVVKQAGNCYDKHTIHAWLILLWSLFYCQLNHIPSNFFFCWIFV